VDWKKIARKTIYKTPFLTLFEDTVELPNGNVVDGYSIVQFPDVIIIVATDIDGMVVTITEYKYGANKLMRSFPAGHMNSKEDPIKAAQRELFEETGYGKGEFKYVGQVREFVTKNLGVGHVVRATNVEKISEQHLDENEELQISLISLKTLHREILDHKWEGAKEVAAITLTDILHS